MLQCKSNQLYEIVAYENIGNIGISAITNIGVSAYRQKCHIGTPLLRTLHMVCLVYMWYLSDRCPVGVNRCLVGYDRHLTIV